MINVKLGTNNEGYTSAKTCTALDSILSIPEPVEFRRFITAHVDNSDRQGYHKNYWAFMCLGGTIFKLLWSNLHWKHPLAVFGINYNTFQKALKQHRYLFIKWCREFITWGELVAKLADHFKTRRLT